MWAISLVLGTITVVTRAELAWLFVLAILLGQGAVIALAGVVGLVLFHA